MKDLDKFSEHNYSIDHLSSIFEAANSKETEDLCLSKDTRLPKTETSKSTSADEKLLTSYNLFSKRVHYEESNEKNSLSLGFSGENITLPSSLIIEYDRSLLYLNLSGNSITTKSFDLPRSLIILNLSYNEITEFELAYSHSNLKLLNVGNNKLKTIKGL